MAMLAAACTGPRPSLAAGTSPGASGTATTAASAGNTGDPNVDALLSAVDRVGSATFTADYSLTRLLGGTTATATVTQAPPELALVVGDTVFHEGGRTRTCSISTRQCVVGIQAQRVSDVATGIGFYGPATAAEIRVSGSRRSGTAHSDERTIAGEHAACVALDVGSGTETYCSLTSGVIALVERADVRVELTRYAASADATLLGGP